MSLVGKQFIGISEGNKDIVFTIIKESKKSVSVTFETKILEGRYTITKKHNITKEHLYKHMRDMTPNSIQFIQGD